jgi:hypothetical protein
VRVQRLNERWIELKKRLAAGADDESLAASVLLQPNSSFVILSGAARALCEWRGRKPALSGGRVSERSRTGICGCFSMDF